MNGVGEINEKHVLGNGGSQGASVKKNGAF